MRETSNHGTTTPVKPLETPLLGISLEGLGPDPPCVYQVWDRRLGGRNEDDGDGVDGVDDDDAGILFMCLAEQLCGNCVQTRSMQERILEVLLMGVRITTDQRNFELSNCSAHPCFLQGSGSGGDEEGRYSILARSQSAEKDKLPS